MTTISSTPKTIYLCGPMRSIPLYNFPAFDKARDGLKAIGYSVISPADLDRECGFDPSTGDADNWNNDEVHACVKRDIEAILECDWVITLPGWEKSIGAKAEVGVAKWLRKPVHELGEILP